MALSQKYLGEHIGNWPGLTFTWYEVSPKKELDMVCWWLHVTHLKCWTWKIFPHLKYRSWSNHLSGRNYYASSHHLYFTQSYDLSHSAGSLNPIESLFRKACWSCQILTWSWTVPLSWDSLYPLVCSVYDQMFSSIEKIKSRGDSSHLVLVVLDP